jgi:hypothetical protein
MRNAAVLLAENETAAGVVLAVLDDRNAFAPTEHIRVTEKMNWVKLEDGLPRYPETVPL